MCRRNLAIYRLRGAISSAEYSRPAAVLGEDRLAICDRVAEKHRRLFYYI